MKIAQIGEDVLRQPAIAVQANEFNSQPLTGFVGELLSTMQSANGVGIAAPQVFDPRAIMYIASRPNPRYPNAPEMQPTLLINPEITSQSNEEVKDWEGCLSVPGIRGCISRPDWVEVSYQDIQGHPHTKRFDGFVARIFLHEFDHLIGKTWLDHVDSSQDIMANEVWAERFST